MMRLPFSLFLAFKYLKPKRSCVSVVTLISMLGVTIGVAVLIVVLSVMNGFDDVWRDKILKFNTHISIESKYGQVIAYPDSILEEAAKVEGVKGVAPCLTGVAMLQTEEYSVVAQLRGVDSAYEQSVSPVPECMKQGEYSLEEEEIVIGDKLAYKLNVHVGDVLTVYAPQSLVGDDEFRLPLDLTVSGIYSVDMYDFDSQVVFTSLETAQSLFVVEQGVHSVQVMLEDEYTTSDKTLEVAERLKGVISPAFVPWTWMEKNGSLFAVLHVEKNMMFFLLAFVAIVAAFSITNTLITLTVQKTREIGLLKSLGFGNGGITGIFFWMGLIQGALGDALGVGIAMLVLKYRNNILQMMSSRFNLELLPPEYYQLSQLPSHISGADVGIVCGLVLVFCTLSGLVPAMLATRMEPVDALRYE
ncbi:MAG: ABC transporter permease [Pontiellaceae bacterium]|nr:ABC transporter permease [Pontiellaceae bacterium]